VVLVLVLVSSRYNTKQRVHGTGRWMECDGSYPSSEWDGMSGVPMMMVVVMMVMMMMRMVSGRMRANSGDESTLNRAATHYFSSEASSRACCP